MGNSNFFLKLVFTVLLIGFISEVGYLAYTKNLLPIKKSAGTNGIVNPEPAVKVNLPQIVNNEEDQAISQQLLENLAKINKEVLTSSELVNSYTGRISEISQEDGLRIKVDSGKHVNAFNYGPNEVALVKVFRSNYVSEPVPASISDLKVGQQIYIVEKLDMTLDLTQSLIEARITYIQK